jgi:hypothetical protein
MSDPGFWKEVMGAVTKIVDVLTKPLGVVSDALSTRLRILLKRKPEGSVTLLNDSRHHHHRRTEKRDARTFGALGRK